MRAVKLLVMAEDTGELPGSASVCNMGSYTELASVEQELVVDAHD
jgi:hypothetical protein